MQRLVQSPQSFTDRRRLLTLLAWLLLWAPRALYHVCTRLRNVLYDCGALRVHRVEAPVISVGNIASGGTGKTPMTALVARGLQESGRRPAVLSRGYGQQKTGGIDDENAVLRQLLPGVPVLVGADRVSAAGEALASGRADCFVLDDGFQYRRLARQLDIVMFDPAESSWHRLLHREPMRALERADVIVLLSSAAQADEVLWQRWSRRQPQAIVCIGRRTVDLLTDLCTGETVSRDELGEGRVGAFCGLGNPAGFRRTVADLIGRTPDMWIPFPDHYAYPREAVCDLIGRARAGRLRWLLTTAKDAVKLPASDAEFRKGLEGLRLVRVGIRLDITRGEAELGAALEKAVGE